MPSFDPVSWTNSISRLWERGSLFLWAVGTAAGIAFLVLVGVEICEPQIVPIVWILIFGLITLVFVVLAAFKTWHEKNIRTLVFFPNEARSFWNHAPQPNGQRLTQIALHGRITNVSSQPIYPTEVRLVRPRSRTVQRNIFTESGSGRVYGSNFAIAPAGRSQFSAHFFADGLVGRAGRPLTVVIEVSDQLGHWHRVTFPDLRDPMVR